MKKFFTWNEINRHDPRTVHTEPWRHGTVQTMVFTIKNPEAEKGLDEHWKFTVQVHYDEGWQQNSEDGVMCTKVRKEKVMKTRWVDDE